MHIGVKLRQKIEKQIAARCIAELLEAGFDITVNDGEEDTVIRSTNPSEIAEAMMSSDEDYLIVHSAQTDLRSGWVRFIYGNDGPDVINDYTVNLEPFLKSTIALGEALEDQYFG